MKEVSQPRVSSLASQQMSAAVTTDVVNDAEESSDASGWDDAWDDEERWGDMEVRSLSVIIISIINIVICHFVIST